MSFHESATNIRLEDDHILVADLENEDGESVEATFDLDEVLGNADGMLIAFVFLRNPVVADYSHRAVSLGRGRIQRQCLGYQL